MIRLNSWNNVNLAFKVCEGRGVTFLICCSMMTVGVISSKPPFKKWKMPDSQRYLLHHYLINNLKDIVVFFKIKMSYSDNFLHHCKLRFTLSTGTTFNQLEHAVQFTYGLNKAKWGGTPKASEPLWEILMPFFPQLNNKH